MCRTRHMMTRMNQRGVTQDLVDLTLQYGECQQNKYVLTAKSLKSLLAALRDLQRRGIRAIDKGGIVVVEDAGQLITTYPFKSYDRRRRRACIVSGLTPDEPDSFVETQPVG